MLKGIEPLTGIMDTRIVVFIDLDEDGMLNVMVQHMGKQGAGRVLFVQMVQEDESMGISIVIARWGG